MKPGNQETSIDLVSVPPRTPKHPMILAVATQIGDVVSLRSVAGPEVCPAPGVAVALGELAHSSDAESASFR